MYADEPAARPANGRTHELTPAQEESRPAPQLSRGASAAQENVVGALLLGARWSTVANIVRPTDYPPDLQLVLTAIARLAANEQAHDPIAVGQELERTGHLVAAGGLATLSELARTTLTTANVADHAKSVRKRAILNGLPATYQDQEGIERIKRAMAEFDALEKPAPPVLLDLTPVSELAKTPAPAARDWILEGIIPARRPTSLLADGGLGKTTIAVQIGVHVAMNRALYGLKVSGGPVLGIFCEDEPEEVDRRVRAACAAEGLELAEVDRFVALSRDGHNNMLCTFEHDQIVLTSFYEQLEATIASFRPRLVILDVLADFFAGDYLNTAHARQFVKVALGGWCVRHACAVLLIAHPSASGMSSGEGGGFSTAWNNAVRSRLYLRRPKLEDPEAAQMRRVLEVRKSNYGPSGASIPLLWQAGAFVPDPNPAEPGAGRAPKVDTKLSIAAQDYLREQGGTGGIVSFQSVYKALQVAGALPQGEYEIVRQPLNRVLKELIRADFIVQSKVPRGYRLSETARNARNTAGNNS